MILPRVLMNTVADTSQTTINQFNFISIINDDDQRPRTFAPGHLVP
jgi:hypothetical protein